MAVSAVQTSLTNSRASLAAIIETEMSYQQTNGPKPSYSVGGRSVSWTEWLSAMLASLKEMDDAIQRASGPTIFFTRGRA